MTRCENMYLKQGMHGGVAAAIACMQDENWATTLLILTPDRDRLTVPTCSHSGSATSFSPTLTWRHHNCQGDAMPTAVVLPA